MNKDEKKKKLKKRVKVLQKILSVFVVVAVAALIAVTAAQKIGNMTIISMTSDIKAYFMSLGSGDGYPHTVRAGEVKDVKVNNTNLIMLCDGKTTVLTSSAKEIMPMNHTYSSPVMKTKGSKMIVFDLESGKFRVQSSSNIIKEYELEDNICAAAIGKSGNYAVGTCGKGGESVFTEYSKRKKEQFSWSFKNERIVDVDLSNNGKYAAVITIGVNSGEIKSKLYVFNFKSDEYVSCFEYPGTTLVRVNYVRNNNIIAVGDNLKTYITDNKNKKDDFNFGSDNLHNYCVTDDGASALVVSKFGSSSLSTLKVFSNKNKEKFSVDFDKEIKWVSCDGSRTAVLFDSEVKTFNKSGKQIGTIRFDGEPYRVVVDGSKTYVLTSVSVKCFNTRGESEEGGD